MICPECGKEMLVHALICKPGKERDNVWWTCTCGRRMYFDEAERDYGEKIEIVTQDDPDWEGI